MRREIITKHQQTHHTYKLFPQFLRDSMSRDLSKDATYFSGQFVFPFSLPLCPLPFLPIIKACVHACKSFSPQIFVYPYIPTNTMSRPTMQTLT